MAQEYVVIDFETTGFSVERNEIIQIGAIKFDENDVELARMNQLVKPQISRLTQKVSDLTGILPAQLENAPIIDEVLPKFLDFIKGHLIVAHNAPFDISFLYQAIIACGISGVEHFQIYDTLTEAKNLVKMRNYKLESFKDVLGMSEIRSHDALNDCLITAKLYQYLQDLENPKPKDNKEQNSDEQLSLFADQGEEDPTITDELRRKLNLPITKELVYYRESSHEVWQKFDVTGIVVEQEYSVGFSLRITLYNGEQVMIHSDFLKEMQKNNFVTTMNEES